MSGEILPPSGWRSTQRGAEEAWDIHCATLPSTGHSLSACERTGAEAGRWGRMTRCLEIRNIQCLLKASLWELRSKLFLEIAQRSKPATCAQTWWHDLSPHGVLLHLKYFIMHSKQRCHIHEAECPKAFLTQLHMTLWRDKAWVKYHPLYCLTYCVLFKIRTLLCFLPEAAPTVMRLLHCSPWLTKQLLLELRALKGRLLFVWVTCLSYSSMDPYLWVRSFEFFWNLTY